MTPEELYDIWSPANSVWSPWVLPVPFAELTCTDSTTGFKLKKFNLDWLPRGDVQDQALVIDLPGGDAIYYGLALLDWGYRPVPVIDGSPGPDRPILLSPDISDSHRETSKSVCIVDMRELLTILCHGAELLRMASLPSGAPPAFLLDSNRMGGVAPEGSRIFDNRWMAFPQDFPSGHFLWNHGVRRVVLVHDTFQTQPPEDLAHVLLRWQEEGIVVQSKSARFGEQPVSIKVATPFRFRVAWYRALAALGLRRNDAGGFGGYPPVASGGG
jgi:hypothetical protein